MIRIIFLIFMILPANALGESGSSINYQVISTINCELSDEERKLMLITIDRLSEEVKLDYMIDEWWPNDMWHFSRAEIVESGCSKVKFIVRAYQQKVELNDVIDFKFTLVLNKAGTKHGTLKLYTQAMLSKVRFKSCESQFEGLLQFNFDGGKVPQR